MPLPIAHSLAGAIVGESVPQPFLKEKWKHYLLYITIANLADLDFLPGFIVGVPNRYHHGYTHTLGFSLFLGFILALLLSKWKKVKVWKEGVFFSLALYSHVILDYLTQDGSPPQGVMAFWPFSSEYLIAAEPIFLKVTRENSVLNFFPSLFNENNFEAVQREFIFLFPILIAIMLGKKYLASRGSKD